MKQYTVAILGATGAVGTQMIQCLEEQNFPVGELRLLASARSAGKKVAFAGGEVTIQEARPEAFAGCDIVLGAVEDDLARELLPKAVEAGAIVVDNSHAFRLDPDVPLVVPEINIIVGVEEKDFETAIRTIYKAFSDENGIVETSELEPTPQPF